MAQSPDIAVRSMMLSVEREGQPLEQVAALQEALAGRDTFIAIAAHELRNPMTPIVGQLGMLVSGIETERFSLHQVKQRLELVQNAVKRYLRRAEVLLDVSRINAQRLRLQPEHCDMSQLVRDIAGEFEPMARRCNVSITVRAPIELPGTWDCLAMEQILDNLLSNAFKHGDQTAIEISAEAVGEEVRITVRDHGRGIATGDRERVFERFEQAVRPGEQRTGFGIGLWLVRELTTALGGTIMIEDAQGGGAIVTVTLPRHTTEAHT